MAEVMISIEVVYAAVDGQALLALTVPAGTTVRAAVAASGLAERFTDLDLAQAPLGIFGKVVDEPELRQVQDGDRIEIYRPLLADPKEVRRLRAQKTVKARKGQKPI